jgi:hypothetical protein
VPLHAKNRSRVTGIGELGTMAEVSATRPDLA